MQSEPSQRVLKTDNDLVKMTGTTKDSFVTDNLLRQLFGFNIAPQINKKTACDCYSPIEH
jgi:hypothetical protein